MRTPRRPDNAVRTPLNRILGTETNVRLLRVLARATTPLAAGELARRATLGRTSVYPALDALEHTGVVEFTGAGAQRHVRLRPQHPLSRALVDLFAAESSRVEKLIIALRGAFQELAPRPTSAWVEGLDGAESAEFDDDTLRVFVLADPKALTSMTDALSGRAVAIERAFGVQLDIRGVSRSELETRLGAAERLEQAVLLDGVPPTALVGGESRASATRNVRVHEDHDVRARRLAVAVAAKLKWDPGLARVARQHLARREKKASPQERRELQEWARILSTMSPGRLQRFLIEPSERATRLRQSLPALGLLTPAERKAVLASSTDEEARAVVSGR